jgi:hypothetical protein
MMSILLYSAVLYKCGTGGLYLSIYLSQSQPCFGDKGEREKKKKVVK